MAVLTTLVGTAVTLARMIDGKYVAQVAEFRQSIVELKVAVKECEADRLKLSMRVAALEAIESARGEHHGDVKSG